jgi:hypothetical protein
VVLLFELARDVERLFTISAADLSAARKLPMAWCENATLVYAIDDRGSS